MHRESRPLGAFFSTLDAGGESSAHPFSDFTTSQRIPASEGAFMGPQFQMKKYTTQGTGWNQGDIGRPFGEGADFGDDGIRLMTLPPTPVAPPKTPGFVMRMTEPPAAPPSPPSPQAGAAMLTACQKIQAVAQAAAPQSRVSAKFAPYIHPMAMFHENAAMSGLWDDIKAAVTQTVNTAVETTAASLTSTAAQAISAGTQKLLGSPTVQKSLAETGKQVTTQAVAEKITQAYDQAKVVGAQAVSTFEKNKTLILAVSAGAIAAFFLLGKKRRTA
jgi:hypothetical protein